MTTKMFQYQSELSQEKNAKLLICLYITSLQTFSFQPRVTFKSWKIYSWRFKLNDTTIN